MRYRITPNGRYMLYSIGWDGKDDQGDKVDLTWQFPLPAE